MMELFKDRDIIEWFRQKPKNDDQRDSKLDSVKGIKDNGFHELNSDMNKNQKGGHYNEIWRKNWCH